MNSLWVYLNLATWLVPEQPVCTASVGQAAQIALSILRQGSCLSKSWWNQDAPAETGLLATERSSSPNQLGWRRRDGCAGKGKVNPHLSLRIKVFTGKPSCSHLVCNITAVKQPLWLKPVNRCGGLQNVKPGQAFLKSLNEIISHANVEVNGQYNCDACSHPYTASEFCFTQCCPELEASLSYFCRMIRSDSLNCYIPEAVNICQHTTGCSLQLHMMTWELGQGEPFTEWIL